MKCLRHMLKVTCPRCEIQITWLACVLPGAYLWVNLLAGGYFWAPGKHLVLFPGLLVG